ncbi:hypothetical protein [Nitrosospira sp. Is2]|uniref:alpha-pore-forming cytotoxin subunit MakB n=1 Tax=Nitrosospira sp. Is2 TaxID=3080532 RepID=UPI002953835C|nr:hypothetical protein [Nitrosospira sp. Is2]WON73723.1 hypothetical protein R5L00_14770 [Nitrosospira sp. Is2]
MLSPNVNNATDQLARGYSIIRQVDAFAFASMNTRVGRLSPNPPWAAVARQSIELLSQAGEQWQAEKLDIWTPVLNQFINYATLFSRFAQVASSVGDDKDAWMDILNTMSAALATGKNVTRAAEGQFTLQINNLNNIRQALDASIATAWNSLASEEQAMTDLATQVMALQGQFNRLGGTLSSAEISAGKNFIQSSVTIRYTVVSAAGVEVPYLAIAGLLFTVGKMTYDLIVTNKEIDQTIGRIVRLRVNMSENAQAAAISKAVSQLIDNFDKSMLEMNSQMPPIAAMWEAEQTKVGQVINAIYAGATPHQIGDLVAMPSAAASWNTLSDFCVKLSQLTKIGHPVTVTTTRPVTTLNFAFPMRELHS